MNAPNPAALAAQAARRNADPGDPDDHPVTETVREILDEVSQIRDAVGDEFDLGATSRQAELLTRAHDALADALEDVGRG
ncbi:hypothetical protein [Gordonia humi]|uniref:Uncharacterized protein n=1 Tax=Gordonia humi TaxID=686429 RepID=A0A840F5G9_9ACTN|nr:hypothetical protein [Gordonia humi]MBB4136749.1 hypothetical protein [Gordonia humi]